jgi:4-hydroxy-tetrahydrodipicolinate synthase
MFYGSIVALVTPFSNNLVDLDALEKLIEWQIDSGTDAVLVCGSTGEGLLISDEERSKIITTSIEIIRKRVPLIVGCSACWTRDAVKLTQNAEKLGANGVLVIAPYYVKPTQCGIVAHFTAVHEQSNIPIIMYNNPGRCAVNMTVDTVIELSRLSRVVAFKDSDTDLTRVSAIRSKAHKLKLLSGDDATLLGYLTYGGDGCISVACNVEPALVKELITSCVNGDILTARKIDKKLAILNDVLFVESNPIPVKYILYKAGFIKNELRSPLIPASENAICKINNAMKLSG